MGEPTEPDGLSLPGEGDPDSDGEGDGEPLDGDGEPLDGEGEAESGDGEAESGDGEPEGGGEPPVGGGVAVGGTGGGGESGGACWKIRIAIRTASAVSSIISSQDARMLSQPALSCRPGHGSGHSRDTPGRVRSIQCSR